LNTGNVMFIEIIRDVAQKNGWFGVTFGR